MLVSDDRRPNLELVRRQIEDASEGELDKVRLLHALYRSHWMKNYYDFLADGLGFRKADFPQFNSDPGVRKALVAYGDALNDWWLNRKKQKVRKNIMVVQPRETAKTSCYTAGTPIWALCQDPNLSTFIMSAEFDRGATKMVSGIKNHLEGNTADSKLTAVFGQFKATNRTWTDTKMVIAQRTGARLDPSIATYSVETGAVGAHCNVGVLDDLVGQAQMEKHGDKWLEKVWTQFVEMNTIITRDGLAVVVGTRYHNNDLIGRIIKYHIIPQIQAFAEGRKGYIEGKKVDPTTGLPEDFDRRWHEYANKYTDWTVIYGQAWHVDEATGKKAWNYPIVWPEEAVVAAQRDGQRGSAWVEAQLQNNPSAREDNPITQQVIDRVKINEEAIPKQAYGRITLHMDTAWKDEEAYRAQRGDWNVIQAWGHYDGHVYLLKQWHGRVTQQLFGEKWLSFLQWAQIVHKSRVELMTYDKPVGGQGTSSRDFFLALAAQAGERCPGIIEIPRHAKKVSRILNVAGFWQDGRVHVLEDVMGADELFHQMLNIGYSEYDDHADTATAVFYEGVYAPGKMAKHSAVQEATELWRWPVEVYEGERDEWDDEVGVTSGGF